MEKDVLEGENTFVLVHEIHCRDLLLDDIPPEDGFTRLCQAVKWIICRTTYGQKQRSHSALGSSPSGARK